MRDAPVKAVRISPLINLAQKEMKNWLLDLLTCPPGVPLAQQFDLTLLDTVDWYGPQYEIRQDHKKVAALLAEDGLDQVEAEDGLVWAVKC